MSKESSARLLELDVFRGIAALSVVLFHYTSQYATLFQHSPELWFYFSFGRHGVELFFIISGFVILMTLERTKSGLDFIVSRFSRLFPPYWVAISLTFIVVTVTHLPNQQVSALTALVNLTMLQGIFHLERVDDVYWTLEIELYFYGLMFLLYQARLLKHIEKIVLAWLGVAIALGCKTYLARWGQVSDVLTPDLLSGSVTSSIINAPFMIVTAKAQSAGIFSQLRDSLRELFILKYAHLFVLGIVLYRAKQYGFTVLRLIVITICILTQKIAYSAETSWETTAFVAAFVLMFYLAMRGYLKLIIWKPLIFLGTISYSLYLIHQNIGYAIIRSLYQIHVNPNVSILVALCVSLLIAVIMNSRVERPTMRFIRQRYEAYVEQMAHR